MASNSIREIRPYLLKVLDEIFKNPPRPPKCSVPVGDFDDARQLFDGHHYAYSMKIEVAVSAWPPFKELFVSESVPGGVHDVTLFKSGKHRIHKANKTLNEKEFKRSESESVYSLSSTQLSSFSSPQPPSLSSQPSFMSLFVSPLLSFPSASSSLSISPPADNFFIVPASVATSSTQSEMLFTKPGMSVMTA